MRGYVSVLACGALLGGCAAGGLSRDAAPLDVGERLPTGVSTGPPFGLAEYCGRAPDECGAANESWPRPARAQIELTDARWRELWDVNRVVNHAIRPATDKALYGRSDYWTRPTWPMERGDCEDYALEKRARLLALGWPADTLAIAIALAPEIGMHATLVAQTDRGDFVLDNLEQAPRRVAELDYAWVSRQIGAGLIHWSVAGTPEPASADVTQSLTPEEVFHQRLAQNIAAARAAGPVSLR